MLREHLLENSEVHFRLREDAAPAIAHLLRLRAECIAIVLLDALRAYDADAELKAAMGEEFSAAYIKLKTQEWNSYASHFTQWERDNTLDV